MFVTFARVARRLPNLVLVGALASCSGDLPTSAFERCIFREPPK
jgi:hypothetical protein